MPWGRAGQKLAAEASFKRARGTVAYPAGVLFLYLLYGYDTAESTQ